MLTGHKQWSAFQVDWADIGDITNALRGYNEMRQERFEAEEQQAEAAWRRAIFVVNHMPSFSKHGRKQITYEQLVEHAEKEAKRKSAHASVVQLTDEEVKAMHARALENHRKHLQAK